jgi:hypothetical protein
MIGLLQQHHQGSSDGSDVSSTAGYTGVHLVLPSARHISVGHEVIQFIHNEKLRFNKFVNLLIEKRFIK